KPAKKRGRGLLITTVILLMLAAAGALAWFQGWIPDSVLSSVRSASLGTEENAFRSYSTPYVAARRQMLHGDFAAASAGFGKIAQDPQAPRAARDWSHFNQGL